MLQALWSLEVLLTEAAVPAGVLIFHLRRVFGDYYQEGRLFGGDGQCHFLGDYRIENLGLTGHFTAIRHGGVDPTPFGPDERHEVAFSGALDPNLERDVLLLEAAIDGAVIGGAAGDPVTLRLTKRAPLA